MKAQTLGTRRIRLIGVPETPYDVIVTLAYESVNTEVGYLDDRPDLDKIIQSAIIETINASHNPPRKALPWESKPGDPEYRKHYAEEFGRFCATKKKCNNLGAALEEFFDGNVHKGPLYLGKLYIEDMKGSPEAAKGRWRLLLDRSEYQSNDLAELEWMLFDFAKREGFLAAYEQEAHPVQSSLDISTAPDVTDAASAEAFVRWCCQNIGRGFHPDSPMADYQDFNPETKERKPTFSPADAAALQKKLDEAFHYFEGCVNGPSDIYRVGLDEMHKLQEDR